jgi:hypothetical protein
MKRLFGLVLIAILLGACAGSSRITGSWKSPKFRGGYNDVMIAALTHDVNAKSTIENDMASAIAARGALVSKSMDIFRPNFTKDIQKEEMMRRIKNSACRAIVTVSLIHKETTSRYVPGTYGYQPMYGYYGRFWGYYTFMYPTIYSPGYYTQDKVYYLETNVYDAKSEELVWSAQSESYNPQNLSGFSLGLADILADKLFQDGILREHTKKIGLPDKDLTSRNRK